MLVSASSNTSLAKCQSFLRLGYFFLIILLFTAILFLHHTPFVCVLLFCQLC